MVEDSVDDEIVRGGGEDGLCGGGWDGDGDWE